MQTKFKRHQKVKLLVEPDPEYIEYHNEEEELENQPKIEKGMRGMINIILPNGRYHVVILDSEGKIIAYAPMDEEGLEAID